MEHSKSDLAFAGAVMLIAHEIRRAAHEQAIPLEAPEEDFQRWLDENPLKAFVPAAIEQMKTFADTLT